MHSLCMFSLKAWSGKLTVTCTCVFSSIYIKLVNIKKKQFWACTHKKQGENYLKKWIVVRRPQSNYQEK